MKQKLQQMESVHLRVVQKLGMDIIEKIYHKLLDNNKDEAIALFRSKFSEEEIYRLLEDLKSAQTETNGAQSDKTKR